MMESGITSEENSCDLTHVDPSVCHLTGLQGVECIDPEVVDICNSALTNPCGGDAIGTMSFIFLYRCIHQDQI